MLRANVNGQLIATLKANEHNSAIGRTPPVIFNFKAGADAATEIAYADSLKVVLTGLCVANSFAGISVRPSAAVFGSPSWYRADQNNDWPEANNWRVAHVLLGNADRTRVQRFSIPFLADATTEADIVTDLNTWLGGPEIYPTPFSFAADRLTQVIQVQITTR